MTTEKIKEFFKNKTVRIVLICLLALILLLVSYRVFASGEGETSGYTPTAREERLIELLKHIEGVDDATVMITEENGSPVGAIILFDGTDGLLVRMRILEISAVALGINQRDVLVYPSA